MTSGGSTRVRTFGEQDASLTIYMEANPFVYEPSLNHFLRGYWSGVVSEIWEQKVECKSDCDDEYRLFVVQPQKNP